MGDSTTTTTTAAPASAQTTAAPAGDTTSAPSGETTAASSTPGDTTTAGGTGPSVTGKFEIDPDDGAPQSDSSIQVPTSARLTLTWSASNATSVNIDGVGDGQPISGSAPIPTQDGSVTLVAVADDGTKSAPVTIQISTHPDGEVVSGHSDISSGIAAVVSFSASKDDQTITHASVGDAVVLTAIVSESTDQVVINDAAADLTETSDGHKQATATITIADGMSGDFTCEVSTQGTAGDPGSLHIDIGPGDGNVSTTTTVAGSFAGSTTTTASPDGTTTANPDGTTTQPGTTTTLDPSSTTTQPGSTTTQPGSTTTQPGSTTTQPGSTTTQPGSTTTQPGTTTTGAIDDSVLTNEKWLKADGSDGTDQIGHGEAVKLYVETPGIPVGTTVYFAIWQQESGGDWVALPGVTAQVAKDDSTGTLSAQADFTTPAETDGSGAGSGSDSGGSAGDSSGDPGTASSGTDEHCSFGFTPSFKDPGSSGS